MSTDIYGLVIERTAGMVQDSRVQQLAAKFGLDLVNVTWEDTARFDDSALGPNISDMTIQVQHRLPGREDYQLTCMPVIRYPNFSDHSADVRMEDLFVLVGNERGAPLSKSFLRELLGDLRSYLHNSESWKGDRRSLLAPDRDSHVLVSAQACFLPIPREGSAEFNPVLFNYQSSARDPAVLAVLATREGTSITIIDNQRDGFAAGATWGQRLFFNQNGERASLTGQRKSDFVAGLTEKLPEISSAEGRSAPGDGLNMVLLIQVPLKQKDPEPSNILCDFCETDLCLSSPLSDVEDAVIGHGQVEGPFTEIDNLEIERDDRFPIRVTVQFYKATSNGVVTEEDVAEIAEQIARVYKQADYVGSLVVDGRSGRPTEFAGPHEEPPNWWETFWRRHFANTAQSRSDVMEMLRRLLGPSWTTSSQAEAEDAIQRADSSN